MAPPATSAARVVEVSAEAGSVLIRAVALHADYLALTERNDHDADRLLREIEGLMFRAEPRVSEIPAALDVCRALELYRRDDLSSTTSTARSSTRMRSSSTWASSYAHHE
jgi:hypothetical protein